MKLYLLLIFQVILISSCTKDSESIILAKPLGCDSMAFTYDSHIKPIIQANCNFPACHATGGEGSYDYTNYAVIAARIRNGSFEQRLHLPIEDPLHMPKDIRMNPCELYSLLTWIKQGYPQN
ncbi:MAG: hypothetical protein EYC69_11005 [Bacteroidetes bacterium]|nr:MAG: hypothetical protein EYC69_11005 [Bacteroidota bacterium]